MLSWAAIWAHASMFFLSAAALPRLCQAVMPRSRSVIADRGQALPAAFKLRLGAFLCVELVEKRGAALRAATERESCLPSPKSYVARS